ncbi:hypothetical protein EV44_g3322 [Erysiphe necator]|uniref:Uncharacterized protein n=1 Tax=Uncinula necator TaxID=52586 RepID=A0A0B1NWK1_UNCNE|nr:hypothetical protein EV44_g3322 [Erysiphe necator]
MVDKPRPSELPQKPQALFLHPKPNIIKKPENRIFIWLLEVHPSGIYHTHAVKSSLTGKLVPEISTAKTILVKLSLVFVPTNQQQQERQLLKAQDITSAL